MNREEFKDLVSLVLVAATFTGLPTAGYVYNRTLDHRAMHQCIDRGGSPIDPGACDMTKRADKEEIERLKADNKELESKLDSSAGMLQKLKEHIENDEKRLAACWRRTRDE